MAKIKKLEPKDANKNVNSDLSESKVGDGHKPETLELVDKTAENVISLEGPQNPTQALDYYMNEKLDGYEKGTRGLNHQTGMAFFIKSDGTGRVEIPEKDILELYGLSSRYKAIESDVNDDDDDNRDAVVKDILHYFGQRN